MSRLTRLDPFRAFALLVLLRLVLACSAQALAPTDARRSEAATADTAPSLAPARDAATSCARFTDTCDATAPSDAALDAARGDVDAGAPTADARVTDGATGIPEMDAALGATDVADVMLRDVATPGDLGPPVAAPVRVESSCSSTVCGGDPTGTWDYAGGCQPVARLFSDILRGCPSAVLGASSATVAGRLRLARTGGIGEGSAVVHANAVATLPPSCVPGGCASTEADFLRRGYARASCAVDGSGCRCDVALDQRHDLGPGMVAVFGNRLSVSYLETTEQLEFCVMGDTLQYRTTSGASDFVPELFTLVRR
jgi:hypothetical protein